MIRPTLLRLVILLLVGCLPIGCLTGGKVDNTQHPCDCGGVVCVNAVINRKTPVQDTGEGVNPCMTCNLTPIGTCADGCTTENLDLPGCAVAYACKTWSRVAVGASCLTDRDCEPGQVAGKPSATLGCQAGTCANLGSAKWASTPTPMACTDSTDQASPACATGGACLGFDEHTKSYTCSAAKCIIDFDCPTGWHCRCAEETTPTLDLRGWRWCVPTAGSDAGVAGDAG
jgi:hypothetical protein